MATDEEKKQPPILFILIVVFTLFLLISIGINHFFQLPRYIPIPLFWRITAGIILLAFGFFILFNALRALTVNRALGEEIYKSKTESRLITTGIYAYTRNPLYIGATLLFFGWVIIFRLTFLLIMTLLFIILFYFVAKWEEKELFERFGEEYLHYKEKVPLFIPYPKKRLKN